jgi:hypothetical protein
MEAILMETTEERIPRKVVLKNAARPGGICGELSIVDYKIRKVQEYLLKQKELKAQYMAEILGYCDFIIKVIYPSIDDRPDPEYFETPIFDEIERRGAISFEAAFEKQKGQKSR